jgi:uncharacterized membrane-anchored protein
MTRRLLVLLAAVSFIPSAALAKPSKPPAGKPAAKPAPEAPAAADEEAAPEEERADEPLPPGVTQGPAKVKIGANAELQVPQGSLYGDAAYTKKWLEESGNLLTGREQGSLITQNATVIFEWEDSGYVKDDDKDKLDADAMLKSLREGQDEANEELKKLGRPELSIDRWQVKPHYDQASNNLEWGPVVKNKQNEHETVNYNVRVLGRRGTMAVTLLVDPSQLDTTLPWFRNAMKEFSFVKGEDYASWRDGDKVAEYGMAALITGGAVAVAAKSGLLAKLIKPILVGIAAMGAWLKNLFTGKKKQPTSAVEQDQQNQP